MRVRGKGGEGRGASQERGGLFGGGLGFVVLHAFGRLGLFKGLRSYGRHDGLGNDRLVGQGLHGGLSLDLAACMIPSTTMGLSFVKEECRHGNRC